MQALLQVEEQVYSPGHKYTATHIFTHNSITSTSWALLFEYVMRKALLHTPPELTSPFFALVAIAHIQKTAFGTQSKVYGHTEHTNVK
uniref:Uncharacterized protein n=1 Tax=Hyaloperonospora arabidopsidis (strain Emoy2) TaxID=559515 RepID=M4BYG0_HYAAE